MKYLLLASTYNNEKIIIQKYYDLINAKLDLDILIIDRGSTDRTKYFLANNNVSRLMMPVHNSYYSALSLGLQYAYENNYDAVVEFDIEGRFAITDIPYLTATYEHSQQDFILGSRYIDREIYHKKRNRFLKFAAWITTRKVITDPSTRFKLYGKSAIKFFGKDVKSIKPEPDRIVQLIKHGYEFKEVQIKMNPKFKRQNPHKWHIALKENIGWALSIIFSNQFRKEVKKHGTR